VTAAVTTWIVGSGFSKPLGGPCIADLFRRQHPDDLRSMYGRYDRLPDCIFKIQRLYALGQRDGLWNDAERYLELLDLVQQSKSSGLDKKLGRLLLEVGREAAASGVTSFTDLSDLARLARRALAAECSYFLFDADPHGEAWIPYREWFAGLSPDYDSVVSFNYDLVPDVLADGDRRCQIVLPGERVDMGKVHIFKLHGSVNWWTTSGGLIAARPLDDALGEQDDIAIGMPGPHKAGLAARQFGELWHAALATLREATRIVFIGYRLPPSDASARHELLGAIRANRHGKNLSIHVVLGTDSPDVVRLRHLLEAIRPARETTVRVHPLWSQDFLGLVRVLL
jgi:hypothetical protein